MAEDHDRIRSKKYMSYLIIFMGLIALVDQYLSLIETSAIPYIREQFNLGLNEFALWQGLFGILAFFVFLLSWVADFKGRKIGILILLLMMSVSALIIGLIGALNIWIFFTFYSILILATNANLWTIPISEESPAKKRAINGSVAFLIGLLPLYAVLGEPIKDAFGWTWMYGVFGIVGFVVTILWFFMKETKRWEEHKGERKVSVNKYRESLKLFSKKDWKFVLIAGFIYFFWNVSFKMLTVSVADFYMNVVWGNLPELEAADTWTTWYTIAGLSTILGALTVGIIMEKIGRIFALIYCSIGAAASVALMAYLNTPIFLVLSYFFMASFLGFLLVYINELFRTKIRATGFGLAVTISRLGYVIGPLLGAWLLPSTVLLTPLDIGTFQSFYLAAAVIILLPLLSLIWNKYETKNKTLESIQEDLK
jgi:putative MFS transporter